MDYNQIGLKGYFELHRHVFKFLGFPLTSNRSTFHKIYAIILLISNVLYTVFVFPEVFKQEDNLNELINSATLHYGYVLVLIKAATLIINSSKLDKLLRALEKAPFAPNRNRGGNIEEILIKNCIASTSKQTTAAVVLCTLVEIAVAAISYGVKTRGGYKKLPFSGTSAVFNERFNYEFLFFFQAIIFFYTMVTFLVVDSLYGSVLQHICTQCKILQHSIKRLIKNSFNDMKLQTKTHVLSKAKSKLAVPWKYLQPRLKEVVKHHRAIINIIEQIEEVFNKAMLAMFLGMSIAFCLLYQGSMVSDFDLRIRSITILVAGIFTLGYVSYWGNEVMLQSQAVSTACYQLEFVGTDLRLQKGLIFIMLRSQRPLKVTAGKFAAISLVALVSILRASYSYFTLLRNLMD